MLYEVKALRGDGDETDFLLLARDPEDAASQACGQGLTVLAIRPKAAWLTWHRPRCTHFPLVQFSQELKSLLDAGLSLPGALETQMEKESRPQVKRTLAGVIERIHAGHTLSHALERAEADIPALFLATLRASEKSGALGEALARFVGYQAQMDAVRRRVSGAALYPLLLAAVAGLAALFLMAYAVPRYSYPYADPGSESSAMSYLLLAWGQWLGAHRSAIQNGGLVLLALLAFLLRYPAGRQWLACRLWCLLGFGARLRIYQLACIYRSLGMLLRGGMPMMASLQMVSGLCDVSLRGPLRQATASVREGQALSVAMQEFGLATPVALRMLRVGERSGRLGEMVERIATFHEVETAHWAERYTRRFKPLLLACFGLAIGGIVVLTNQPVLRLAGNLH